MSVFFATPSGGNYKGKIYGFPIGGKCTINRECKLNPILKYYRQYRKEFDIVQYVGIATDEPNRIPRLDVKGRIKKVSLLLKYGYTEAMAKEKCLEYGLLSPIYREGTRGGVGSVLTAEFRHWPGSVKGTLIYGKSWKHLAIHRI